MCDRVGVLQDALVLVIASAIFVMGKKILHDVMSVGVQ
jgi:hypothetical protein